MRCQYSIFNTRNIQEKIDSFARGTYYHLFKQYVYILLTKMRTDTKCVPWTWYIFNLRKSLNQIAESNKHANDGIWIRPRPNINDSTRSLSTGIENISIRPVFSKLPSRLTCKLKFDGNSIELQNAERSHAHFQTHPSAIGNHGHSVFKDCLTHALAISCDLPAWSFLVQICNLTLLLPSCFAFSL